MNIQDKAQNLAEKIRLMLTRENDFEIKLKGSSIWLADIHGSGYVAWAEDNVSLSSNSLPVYPEQRHIGSGLDYLPTAQDLERFINACQHLADLQP